MSLAEQLEATWSARVVADHPWSSPSLGIAHLMGVTVVFGGIVLLDLRLLGPRRALPTTLQQPPIPPRVWVGFAYFYAFKF